MGRISSRGSTGKSSYFVTAATYQRKCLLQSDRMAQLFIDVLFHYRSEGKYLLHEYVVMPDHFHLLISPLISLERAMQLIKGGFSYRARKELGIQREIWESSFHDRRIRDSAEYENFCQYIAQNPVRGGLADIPEHYLYCSAGTPAELDSLPQRLKPLAQIGSLLQG
jgi:putative transposase